MIDTHDYRSRCHCFLHLGLTLLVLSLLACLLHWCKNLSLPLTFLPAFPVFAVAGELSVVEASATLEWFSLGSILPFVCVSVDLTSHEVLQSNILCLLKPVFLKDFQNDLLVAVLSLIKHLGRSQLHCFHLSSFL